MHIDVPLQILFRPAAAQMCASAVNGQWHNMPQIYAEPAGYRHVRLWEEGSDLWSPRACPDLCSHHRLTVMCLPTLVSEAAIFTLLLQNVDHVTSGRRAHRLHICSLTLTAKLVHSNANLKRNCYVLETFWAPQAPPRACCGQDYCWLLSCKRSVG